ncbi:MAG: TIGR02206 family membrane protein [Oscillospiraceae bacterium]|nr:TIGR02206 family membrane protein [Oscillospiraceae bacterium]
MKEFFYFYTDNTIRTPSFTTPHLIWLFSVIFLWIFALVFFKNKTKHTKDIFLYCLAIILIAAEALRYYVLISNGVHSFVALAPFDLCGFMVYITFFAIFLRKKMLMNLCYAFSFIATIFGVLTPSVVNFPTLSYIYIQGMLSHGIMFLTPMFFIVDCGFRPDVKYVPRIFALFAGVTFLFIAPLDYFLKANWFFIAWAPIGTPIEIFQNLVGWPGYIGLMFVLLIIIWTIMYLPFYLAERSKRRPEKIMS